MSLIPDEQLKKGVSFNFAPMVDFLFVIVAVFATIAITRAFLYDTEMKLVRTGSGSSFSAETAPYLVNIGITHDGKYKWMTEVSEFLIESPEQLQYELEKQKVLGLIPKDPEQTKILLHIDRRAEWGPIASAIFSLRDQGFPVHPVYEPDERHSTH